MVIEFSKYQGAGNDFVICDDRERLLLPRLTQADIARICDRRFGVGADGLMLLAPGDGEFDFRMIYYNSDGRESTMCGNGGRCIVRFARERGIERTTYRFLAIDGPHDATILENGTVALGMQDVNTIERIGEDLILDTGSPHYLRFVPNLDEIDVPTSGRSIRRSPPFATNGINVNFVEADAEGLRIGTYERGVEDETLACGTGVTAAAIGELYRREPRGSGKFHLGVRARGGELAVTGERVGSTFQHIRLIGPATFVFSGTLPLADA
ncbi:diaminopimelate epimerase [Lewinella sp. IMCC34191]|uniref:diaminopimelate epimerase n=1 Tax=Lewinella sp. IMCC34191 TaxID=2259172 RepID=UPI000E24CB06|nr:diaminopimelate epimerase [Lewinella sp. IMCC34191]